MEISKTDLTEKGIEYTKGPVFNRKSGEDFNEMIAMSDLKPILNEINQNLINFTDAKDDLPSYEKWSEIDFSEELKQLEEDKDNNKEEKEEGDQIEVKPE